MSNVNKVWATPNGEQAIMYCARVSNPANQSSTNTKLLEYCIREGHWSVFEMANLCVEINCSRAIARQILRHRSFSFQEFSQRYANVHKLGQDMVDWHPRSQDTKNRQASHDDLDPEIVRGASREVDKVWQQCIRSYDRLIAEGVAKECARAILPEGLTPTRMYMNGSVRSWMHFLQLRTGNGTQLECREVAEQCKEVFSQEFPVIAKVLWGDADRDAVGGTE